MSLGTTSVAIADDGDTASGSRPARIAERTNRSSTAP
jgi:hypothetical protein